MEMNTLLSFPRREHKSDLSTEWASTSSDQLNNTTHEHPDQRQIFVSVLTGPENQPELLIISGRGASFGGSYLSSLMDHDGGGGPPSTRTDQESDEGMQNECWHSC